MIVILVYACCSGIIWLRTDDRFVSRICIMLLGGRLV